MAAIRGVVTRREGQTLLIKLETGPSIQWPDNGTFDVFDNVFVGFNHYTREYVSVLKREDDIDTLEQEADELESDESNLEEDDAPDYGVL